MDQNEAKRMAAEAAAELLPNEGVIGLGTGSTAKLFIEAMARRIQQGARLVGVPTSDQSRKQAASLGIPLLDDVGPWDIALCVDGADEVSEGLDLIKGGGACHTREKIVNHASRRNVIVVDDSKVSRQLGEKWAVPVEVLRFGEKSTARALSHFGSVSLRMKDGAPWVTDSGNVIYDVKVGPMPEPSVLDAQLQRLPGVVDTGLFCGRADLVIVAGPSGLRRMQRPAR